MVAVGTSADATALLARWRTGDLEACHQLTQHLQPETFDLALLLTGDPERAARLAADAILSVLDDTSAVESDPRLDALEALISSTRQRHESFGSVPSTPTDDERTRVHAALSMASPSARVMIGMTRLLGFAPSTAGSMLSNPGSGFAQQVEIAERRLYEAAGAQSAAQLYLALSRYISSFPRPDLWAVIKPQVESRLARRRQRKRMRNWALLGVTVIATIAGLYWLIGPKWGSTKTPAPQPAVAELPAIDLAEQSPMVVAVPVSTVELPAPPNVPDAELIIASGSLDGRPASFYRFEGDHAVELGPGSDVAMAGDASWFVLREPLPDSTEHFTAIDATTMQASWSITTEAPSATALTSSTLVLLQRDGEGGYRLDRYLASDGSSLPEIPIPETANDEGGSRLTQIVPSQDGDTIYVLVGTSRYHENIWTLRLITISSDTGEVIDSRVRESGPASSMQRDFSVTGARLTVDGSALYSMVRFDNRDRVGVQFLDVESGELTSVTLPFPRRTDSALVDVQAIPSNSGRLLYVLSTLERQIAVIDLVERQLNGIYPVEPGAVQSADYFASFRRAAYVLGDLSPDGKLLYLGLIALNNSQSPIWVIDTSSWQAVGSVATSGKPFGMHLSADGNTLWLQITGNDGTQLSSLDVASGVEHPIVLPADVSGGDLWLTSLHGFYRWQYGRTPATDTVTPVDNEQIAVLPAARISAGPVTAGIPREITVQLIDPLTGEPLTEAVDDIRFDPEAQMTLTLSHDSGATVLLMPYQSSAGEYRGKVMLDRSGRWTLSAHFTSPNGATWDVAQLGTIDALPGLVGDDGLAYVFEAQPETMISGRTVTVFGWVVSADSGARMRDDVSLASGFPRIIRLALLGPGLRQRIVLLQHVGHARYLGWVRLEEPGTWKVTATVARDHDDPVEITLQDWQVHELGIHWTAP